MRPIAIAILALISISFVGCKSKQDQLAELNARFDTLNAQYQKDCITASVEEIQKNQVKCKAERDAMNPLGKKILALQADVAASKH